MPETPKIPRGPLWTYLLAPPLLMAASTLITFGIGNSQASSSVMTWLPVTLGLLTLATFMFCLVGFVLLINRRYSTGTVLLLSFGYVIGQGVVSFAMFFGACLMMFRV